LEDAKTCRAAVAVHPVNNAVAGYIRQEREGTVSLARGGPVVISHAAHVGHLDVFNVKGSIGAAFNDIDSAAVAGSAIHPVRDAVTGDVFHEMDVTGNLARPKM